MHCTVFQVFQSNGVASIVSGCIYMVIVWEHQLMSQISLLWWSLNIMSYFRSLWKSVIHLKWSILSIKKTVLLRNLWETFNQFSTTNKEYQRGISFPNIHFNGAVFKINFSLRTTVKSIWNRIKKYIISLPLKKREYEGDRRLSKITFIKLIYC